MNWGINDRNEILMRVTFTGSCQCEMGRRARVVEAVEPSGDGSSVAHPPQPPPTNLSPSEVYQKVIEFEESEAKHRSAEKDATLFYTTCDELRKLFKSIDELKSKNPKLEPNEINSIRDKASLLIVTLKKLNRLEKIRTKAGRDALHREKQKLDSMHLLLQNLLYEAKHLDKETTKCLQFKSKDEEIDLVPVDQFFETAPEDVSRPTVTKNNDHQLRLARLEWELRQRRELSESCSQLQENASKISTSLAEARARLDGLAPKLRDALVAAEPLKEVLGLHVSESLKVTQEPATLLPAPLFLLYARVLAFIEAFSKFTVQTSIMGDENEARQFEISDNLPIFNDTDSDQDTEMKEEEDNQGKKKRRHRTSIKLSKKERTEERLKIILKVHPLKVTISVKEKETSLIMTFSYLVNLKIITVKSSIELPKPIPAISGEVLNSQNILQTLFLNDDGSDSPHPATSFIFKSSGIEEDFSHFIPQIGKPYIWAQRMCGIDFTAVILPKEFENAKMVCTMPPIELCSKLSSASVENIIMGLQKHVRSRLNLMNELQKLESGNLPPFEGTVRLMGSLTQWQAISWSEYSQAISTSNFINLGLVSQNDMFFRAIITRQSAKLVALVALKSNYPKETPIFSLTLHWNGTHHSKNNDDIRDIERCVNTDLCTSDASKPITLIGQITRLITCLDILLEAIGSSEFPPDKIILRPVRGRHRMKPYKLLKQGSGVFIQY